MGENLFLFNLEEKKRVIVLNRKRQAHEGIQKEPKLKKKTTKDGWFPARVFSFRYNYLD